MLIGEVETEQNYNRIDFIAENRVNVVTIVQTLDGRGHLKELFYLDEDGTTPVDFDLAEQSLIDNFTAAERVAVDITKDGLHKVLKTQFKRGH